MNLKKSFLLLWCCSAFLFSEAQRKKKPETVQPQASGVWPVEKAKEWYARHKWISGANFIPSNAINQLEMWQADTFDSATIDRELGWAEGIGFNTMRVYLHSMAWTADSTGFKNRMDAYLRIADRHKIKTIFVFFDDVWNKDPRPGKQPVPVPGVHNSGWMQDPGQSASYDSARFPALERYVKSVLHRFRADGRVLLWDLYNEPGNSRKGDSSLALLQHVFRWARAMNPEQPVSAGLWKWDEDTLNAFQFANSDIITYHDYGTPEWHQRVVDLFKAGAAGRPLICTEYMARTRNSRFWNIMPMLKRENVGAINWGLVEGKTNTIYQWDTPIAGGAQPDEWFHDVFYRDGTPYRRDEISLIKKLNEQK